MKNWLEPVFAQAGRVQAALAHGEAHGAAHSLTLEWIFISIALSVASLGTFLAYYFYRRRPELPALIAALGDAMLTGAEPPPCRSGRPSTP